MKQRSTASFGVRLLLQYLLASFFCLLLVASLSFWVYSIWVQLILFLCTSCITYMLIYQYSWDLGNHDANGVSRGIMNYTENRGFFAGLFTLIVPFVMLLLAILSAAGVLPEWIFRVHNFASPCFYVSTGWIFSTVQEYSSEAGKGLAWMMCLAKDAPWYGFILETIPMLLMPFFSWLGYKLGRRRIILADKIMYRSPKKRAEIEHKRIARDNKRTR